MYLFIFESIGTSELILIAIVGLVFLGPRKLPEIARQVGKFMAEFRNTTSDFKETWQREVNFEQEEKAIKNGIYSDAETTEQTQPPLTANIVSTEVTAPTIKSVDKEQFEKLGGKVDEAASKPDRETAAVNDLSDKRSWL